MELLNPGIIASKNGWRQARVRTTSSASNTTREWDVRWRAVGHTCGEKTRDRLPVWEDSSYGDLRVFAMSHTPDSHCYGSTQVTIQKIDTEELSTAGGK